MITLVTALTLGIGAVVVFRHAKPFLVGNGCRASVAGQVVELDPEQAAIAATIAGVGYHRHLPAVAVTVAYATALQESHLHNVQYGDRDSVGIFQQRPSQGWGTSSQLRDPVYAASKFFAALVKVPGYEEMPVYRAAQAVQHSADGTAYGQYEQVAEMLSAAFTGNASRAVSCWYTPYSKRPAQFSPAMSQLSRTFGQLAGTAADPAHKPVTTEIAAHGMFVPVPQLRAGWAVATWSVAHAKIYGIKQVRFAGYQWRVSNGVHGWKAAQGAPTTAVELN